VDISITAPDDATTATPSGGCGGSCTCGAANEDTPALDVRAIPHSIRHATVLGAVSGIAVGTSLVLIAPHDPLPLLGEIDAREPGAFDVAYDARGPEAWHVRQTRVG
jgi:uncharacterized protein (DUF2249 family)